MGIIPQRFQHSRFYPIFQQILRVFQFLSATISLGLFSARLYKIYRTVERANRSYGAVEGILAAAVAYTLTMMLLKFCLKGGASNMLRWIMVVLDLLFVGAFIAVAVLTRPNGGPSGPCPKYQNQSLVPQNANVNCNLPWGTFILAIISTLLHALTALFHEVRKNQNQRKADREMGEQDGMSKKQRKADRKMAQQNGSNNNRSHY